MLGIHLKTSISIHLVLLYAHTPFNWPGPWAVALSHSPKLLKSKLLNIIHKTHHSLVWT